MLQLCSVPKGIYQQLAELQRWIWYFLFSSNLFVFRYFRKFYYGNVFDDNADTVLNLFQCLGLRKPEDRETIKWDACLLIFGLFLPTANFLTQCGWKSLEIVDLQRRDTNCTKVHNASVDPLLRSIGLLIDGILFAVLFCLTSLIYF